ncbi:PREDICTED: bis(5'-nucleosyl)-tetraphosphatase [asymmetrical]-like [Priapulus caudatus]|uniref:Bis(5'-nucleosyl)-tetraphosphatase [asymmetrical] n=1 Tax=Priapulus caudatus TaxID=37621 RepID=A0ABM1ET84_PRICU|nr:PREDICTED: bis(5'-nucleosyl)-tetraphosphatase [asymmetrical]-like [Priapulus caudatus]XP_014675406.1 PREDICTED: bis(5'-nucleosyl)-tetraphosphatase [asymmetrical]-like [Priapulus caudatus]
MAASAGATALRAAGLVIFRRHGDKKITEYLLMQTSYGNHHWTPPKGHVDPGESDMETALRETKEESGLQRNSFHVVDEFRRELCYDVFSVPKTVVYWLAELIEPEPLTPIKLSAEHQAYDWLQLEDACSRAGYEEMQSLLREADAFINLRL